DFGLSYSSINEDFVENNAVFITDHITDVEVIFPECLSFIKSKINSNNRQRLSTRSENNYLRLILTLANNIPGFNPQKPYEAAKLIVENTEIDISQQTIADYITKAYALESKNRD